MIIKNTEAGRIVQRVAATMAIEDMYVSKEFIEKLLKVSNGEMTSEELRKEVLKEYAQNKLKNYIKPKHTYDEEER